MISVFIWLMILSSGSVLAAVLWNRKYEEILPITCSVIIAVLFLFGIFGQLKVGSYFVVVGAAAIYLVSLIVVMRRKNINCSKCIVTPAFCFFMLFVVLICWCNYGKLAVIWDEFSHWMDIVKVMATLDAFGTHPEAESMFQSYPPAMSLFQYFLQKVNLICVGTQFSEWMAYAAYQIFFVSFLIPFFKEFNFKNFISLSISFLTILLCPVFFFESLYNSIYVDPILGILMGSGMARIFAEKKKDAVYDLTIISTCIMLVLMKDAGMLFAIFLGVFFCLDRYMGFDREDHNRREGWRGAFSATLCCFGGIVLFKTFWNQHLKWTNANIKFSEPYDVKVLIDVVTGKDTTYRYEVWKNFWEAVATRRVMFADTEYGITYLQLFILLIVLLIVIAYVYTKGCEKKGRGFVFVAIEILLLSIYVFGLCITYVTKFSEYEALRLASFDRYMGIGYLALWFSVIVLGIIAICRYDKVKVILEIFVFASVLCIIPKENIGDFVDRDTVRESRAGRELYDVLVKKIETHCTNDDRVYFIAQETSGYDYWVTRYSIRPVKMNGNFSWSIGEPFYEEDIFTRAISAEEWKAELIDQYDYVGIYTVNDYFVDKYGILFDDPTEIASNELYRVNKTSGMLEKCN